MMRPVVISGCLAGLRVRYDGASRSHPFLGQLAARAVLVPVCPEILGGLPIPRTACRFVGGDGEALLRGQARVVDRDGVERTDAFLRGAEEVIRIVELVRPSLIILKEGSPSCGVHRVDTDGVSRPGCGVTTARLRALSVRIISEDDPLPACLCD